MDALFIALGIMVLALLALLLWFVPHLLQQQAVRVARETTQLRDMLLDLLNEQEAVTLRQTQLGSSLAQLRDQLELLVRNGSAVTVGGAAVDLSAIEGRISELQGQIQEWASRDVQAASRQKANDNESWAYLLSLLAAIQERVGAISQDRAAGKVGLQAAVLLEELEQEMQHLRGISEDIGKLQWRLRKSLHERDSGTANVRSHANGVS